MNQAKIVKRFLGLTASVGLPTILSLKSGGGRVVYFFVGRGKRWGGVLWGAKDKVDRSDDLII